MLTIARLFITLGFIGTILIVAILIFTMSGARLMNTFAMEAIYLQLLPYYFSLVVTACLLTVLIAIEEYYRKRTLKLGQV